MNGHRLAPADRDGGVVDADGDRVAAEHAFVQHFDPRVFHEAHLDQAAFQFGRRQHGSASRRVDGADPADEAALGLSERTRSWSWNRLDLDGGNLDA